MSALVEAREEDQPVGAGRVELPGEVREGGEERRQLDGDRDAEVRFTSRTISMACRSTSAALDRHVAGGVIEVQLEAVGAGLFEQLARRRSSRPA